MAAVPRGSSLFIGQGAAQASASAATGPLQPGSLKTPEPPPTDTVMDTASRLVNSPPLQGAAAVAAGILFLCWLLIRWYDKGQLRRG
jgi:hypothetical protein